MASRHDIIVIGGSAGCLETLQKLVHHLPADLPSAVFVVMHVPPRSRSFLPEILTRAGALRAVHPNDRAAIQPGRIYVAPPDHHLLVEHDHIHLTCGPREQHHRPSINVTFRSAALAHGDGVIGVLLSGELDDGTAGLWEIKRRGGIAVVQNPEDAAFPSMPLSALREIEIDHTVAAAEMGGLLTRLTGATMMAVEDGNRKGEGPRMEAERQSQPTDVTCPECRGTIWEVNRGHSKDYRCRVGHTYSARSMLAGHFAAQEKALYAAIVALEEGASLAARLADQFNSEFAERLRAEARQREEQAGVIRQLLNDRVSFDIE